MAIGLVLDIPGGTREFYDSVCRTMNWPDDWPEGQIAHYAGTGEGFWRVVDIWETREHFDRFARDRLGPAAQEASGGQAPPMEPVFFEIVSEVTAPTRV
jgi:hypothetical protein